MIICLMCGANNDFGTNHCVQCGAKLPKLDERTATMGSTPRSTAKYEVLRDWIMKIKIGERSWVEFEEWFAPFAEDITVKIRAIVEQINLSHGQGWSYYEEFTEEVEAVFAGVEDYDASLEQIWQSMETQDLVMAQNALKQFLRGAEKLNDASALNAETKRKLEDGWGYL